MSLIVEGKNLFAMMVKDGGVLGSNTWDLTHSNDVKNLIDSGIVEVSYGVVATPGIKLRLKLNEKELALMKKIIDSKYKGVPASEAVKDVPLPRLRELRIRYGIIRTEKKDGKVYLKF